jgi:anti-sigma factor RsiW
MQQSEDLTCAEIVEIVTDYLEGALDPGARRLFEEHLDICEGCATYLAQMKTTIELTGDLREEDLPPETRAGLLDAFRGWRASSG